MVRSPVTLLCSIAAAVLLLSGARTDAQCQPQWLVGPNPGVPGVERYVYDSQPWDPDGPGPQPEVLVIAGQIWLAGQTSCEGIATWNGSSFATLGEGLQDGSYSLAVYNGQLYAGGYFTSSGTGVPMAGIARWNGTNWQDVGGSIQSGVGVFSLCVYNGNLYAAGNFSNMGGVPAESIARWNGTTWQALGQGITGATNPGIFDLEVYNGQLYAGGRFDTAGGLPSQNLARWNGSTWQQFPTGADDAISAFTLSGTDLVAVGSFGTIGGVPALRVARYDGAAWHAYGSGISSQLGQDAYDAIVYNGALYVSGNFQVAAGAPGDGVARWSGTTWESIGGTQTNFLLGMSVYQASLYVGGFLINDIGGVPARGIARYDGANWHALGLGTNNAINGFARYNNQLYAAGNFTMIQGQAVRGIARWNGSQWQSVGVGVNAAGNNFELFQNQLIATGSFTQAGGASVTGIASWNGAVWQAIGGPFTHSVNPVYFRIRPLATYNNELIAAGVFDTASGTPARNIARWNGSSWQPLGTGIEEAALGIGVNALAVHKGSLYAAGSFSSAGGVAAANVARWDGTNWHAVGAGLPGPSPNSAVTRLSVYRGEVYAGFAFITTGPNPLSYIARWDGAAWQPVGTAANGGLGAMRVIGGDLVVAGAFTAIGGVAAPGVAKWNGTSWQAYTTGLTLPHGPVGGVSAIFEHENSVYFGGSFTFAGGQASAFVARWGCPCYTNCDNSTGNPALTANDFVCFLTSYATGNAYANCDGSNVIPVLTANDFICYIARFAGGCL